MKRPRRRGWRLAACLAVLAATALPLAACGGDDSPAPAASAPAPPPGVRATLATALAAFADGDVRELCAHLSPRAKLVIGFAQHGSLPLVCPEDVSRYVDSLTPYPNGPPPLLTAIDYPSPNRAVALYRLPDGMRATIPLSRGRDGRWRLDGLLDSPLSTIQIKTSAPGPDLPSEEDLLQPVRLPPRPGAPGPRMRGRGVRVSLQTPFGFMHFAACQIDFQLRTGPGSRVWLTDTRIQGPSPCLDMYPCLDKRRRVVPWPATLVPAGGDRMRLRVSDACVDTCLGLARGRWDLDLAPTARGWRASSEATIGTSGWRVDGTFESLARGPQAL